MAIDILPVSSDTIIAIQSLSSLIPNAARCRVPNFLFILPFKLIGNTAPALVILFP